MMRQVQGEDREELQQHEFRSLMAHSLTQGSCGGSAQSSDASPMSFQEVRCLLRFLDRHGQKYFEDMDILIACSLRFKRQASGCGATYIAQLCKVYCVGR